MVRSRLGKLAEQLNYRMFPLKYIHIYRNIDYFFHKYAFTVSTLKVMILIRQLQYKEAAFRVGITIL